MPIIPMAKLKQEVQAEDRLWMISTSQEQSCKGSQRMPFKIHR